jgi:flagellar FliL protein
MATSTIKDSRTDPKAPGKSAPAKDAAEAEVTPAPRKKRGLLKVLLLLLPLLGAAGGGAWYFLQAQEPAAAKPGAPKTAAAKAVSSKPPVFVTLDPFTVNLQHEDASPQYLQVGLALKVADAAVVDAIKLRMPEIRNRVLLLLSSKKAGDIMTLEGKQTLSAELTREISQPLAGSVPAPALDSVLFTSFVIQ